MGTAETTPHARECSDNQNQQWKLYSNNTLRPKNDVKKMPLLNRTRRGKFSRLRLHGATLQLQLSQQEVPLRVPYSTGRRWTKDAHLFQTESEKWKLRSRELATPEHLPGVQSNWLMDWYGVYRLGPATVFLFLSQWARPAFTGV